MERRSKPARRAAKAAAAAIGVTAAIWAGGASAAVIVLDFESLNGENVSQSYGDSAGADVSYRSTNASNGTTHSHTLHTWTTGYGDLTNVIFGGSNATQHGAEITFAAKEGYELRLISFDFAAYQNLASSTPIAIGTLGGQSILSGQYGISPTGHEHLAVNSNWVTDGIRLSWGPDAFNVGLDNIAFEVRALPSAVPEPATWAMMILGIGGVGAVARRRRAASGVTPIPAT